MPVQQEILTHQLENGLTLLAEPMPWLESAAFALMIPAGCSGDPPSGPGLCNFTCEMVQRGCGERDNRRFVEDLDSLGVDRSSSVGVFHSSYGGAMPAENLLSALAIYADLAQRPLLPANEIEEGRMVCFQEVRAIEDDLPQKVMQQLRRRHYGDPYGRSSQGTMDAIAAVSIEDIRRHFETAYRPNEAILSVAGRLLGGADWARLKESVETLFGGWSRRDLTPLQTTTPARGYEHIPFDSSQTQIGLAYPSVPYGDPDYYHARGAVGVLSDGMSSRLFTEIREKRGLCYTVYASLYSLKDQGGVHCYSGTSTDRAQSTLDVLLSELDRLSQGIQEEELARLKVKIKSSLIMQQESSASRASAIAADWFYLQRTQTLQQVLEIVDQLTCRSINQWLADHPPKDFTIVTLGEQPLETPLGIS